MIKAELVREINNLITARNLTQTETAELLGVDQPRVSALLHGKPAGFSTQLLFRFLNALGSDVEIHVIPKSKSDSQDQTIVITV